MIGLAPVLDPAEVAEGQRRLAIAMLRQAAADLTSDDGNTVEAEVWIAKDEDEMPGFVWCCHILGLRHLIVRDTLRWAPGLTAASLARFTEAHHKSEAA